MPLTNAERQKRFRQRLKARAAGGPSLYDALVTHFRACADKDGKLRRGPRRRGRFTPEELANEICDKAAFHVKGILGAILGLVRTASGRDCPAELTLNLGKIVATLAPPDHEAAFDPFDY